ncbi:MAG TPA: hypothetical protein VMU36_04545 [Spirochaetia bacterium]|nr:hypothetical protein [Spirochaetia bacterium]
MSRYAEEATLPPKAKGKSVDPIRKPFDAEAFLRLLRQVLDRPWTGMSEGGRGQGLPAQARLPP